MDKNPLNSPSPVFLVKKKFTTKFEKKFFKSTERCRFILHFDSMKFSIEKMNRKIEKTCSGFQKEIFENIALFNGCQKIIYLNRILEKLHNIDDSCISGFKHRDIRFSFNGMDFKSIPEFSEYGLTISRKKNEMNSFVLSLMTELGLSFKEIEFTDQLPVKPIFNPEYVTTLYEIIKPFFVVEQHLALNQLLESGLDADTFLIFWGCGNRLADVFKQFFNAGLIVGCDKKELESWIARNFKYSLHQKPVSFNPNYLNKIISSNMDSCRNPLINIYKNNTTGKFSIKTV